MGKKNQVSALWQKPGSAAEGTFGRRTSLGGSFRLPKPAPESWSFGSVRDFRPPKVPPKVPPNMHEFRLCLGVSAAEGAAEPA